MTKLRSLCIIALLFFALTCAARPDPASSRGVAPLKDRNMNFEGEVDNCEGVGEDECLMRRTLTAHLDYIYTQKHDKP